MSFHNFKIIPKSDTIIELSQINEFISELQISNLIIEEPKIYKGDFNNIKDISLWNFENKMEYGDVLNEKSNLEVVNDINNLSKNENYAFKIKLNGENSELKQLNIFKDLGFNTFPVFLIHLSKSFNIKEYKLVDEENEIFDEIIENNINSLLKTFGHNAENLYGLGEKKELFENFYNKINLLYKDYEIVNYYD